MSVEEFRAKQREKDIQRSMATCRHFSGLQNKKCDAGIDYDDVLPLPCVPISSITQGAQCALKSCYTREEAEVLEEVNAKRREGFVVAYAAAKDDAHEKGYIKGHGGRSSVKCPVCADGQIRYNVASSNGHMMAACNTSGCVSWLE